MIECACRKPFLPSGLAAWFRSLSLSTCPSTVITIRFSSQSMRHTWNLADHSVSSKDATGLRRVNDGARVDPGAHLEPSVAPALDALGGQAGRGVFGKLALALPIRTARLVVGVGHVLAARFDDQHAVLAPGVGGLVPRQLLVAHEPGFVGPARRVGTARLVELIAPDQLPGARAGWARGGGASTRLPLIH